MHGPSNIYVNQTHSNAATGYVENSVEALCMNMMEKVVHDRSCQPDLRPLDSYWRSTASSDPGTARSPTSKY